MEFDLSNFTTIGEWLFKTGSELFKLLEFNFGSFTVNGWGILLGFAIFCLVCWLLGKIFN